MKTCIKTMVRTKEGISSGQRHASITLWTRDANKDLRGIWISGSTFRNETSILNIRTAANGGRTENCSGIFKSLDNSVEFATIHGKVKARICKNRIYVSFPNPVVTADEFPAR
jgi:hypothetical protein